MVQILKAPERKPSVGQRLSQGLGRGLEMGAQMYAKKQGEQLAQAQNQAKMQHEMQFEEMKQKLQAQRAMELEQSKQGLIGKRTKELEEMKQQGRQNLQGQKQELLNEIFGQKQRQAQQMQEPGQSQNQQQSSYDPLKISDADIARASSMDPNLGRELRYAKDSARREQISKEKLDFQKEKISPEHQRQQHLESSQAQADVKYNQQLQETSKQHELKERSLDRLEKLNKKGVTGKPWEKLAEKAGLINITSEGRREFAAEVKSLITDIRSILGGQFSNFEFQTILNAYPSADFSKEANSAIIKNLKEFQDIKHKEVEYAQELKKENGGKLPVDFQSKVNEKVREYTASRLPEIKENTSKILNEEYGIPSGYTLMFDENEEPLSVPASEVSKYLDLGASLP